MKRLLLITLLSLYMPKESAIFCPTKKEGVELEDLLVQLKFWHLQNNEHKFLQLFAENIEKINKLSIEKKIELRKLLREKILTYEASKIYNKKWLIWINIVFLSAAAICGIEIMDRYIKNISHLTTTGIASPYSIFSMAMTCDLILSGYFIYDLNSDQKIIEKHQELIDKFEFPEE